MIIYYVRWALIKGWSSYSATLQLFCFYPDVRNSTRQDASWLAFRPFCYISLSCTNALRISLNNFLYAHCVCHPHMPLGKLTLVLIESGLPLLSGHLIQTLIAKNSKNRTKRGMSLFQAASLSVFRLRRLFQRIIFSARFPPGDWMHVSLVGLPI